MKTTLLTVLLFVAPAWADSFPTDLYFYTCNSGVVDCNAFPKHWYGDFGMNGLDPVDAGRGWGAPYHGRPGMFALASNINGEVIGTADGGMYYEEEPVYGHDGVVLCVDGDCICDCGPGALRMVDIDNSGFWVMNDYLNIDIGSGDTVIRRISGVGEALGINDQNQILIGQGFGGGPLTVLGVLSPVAVPEPMSVFFLATVVCTLALVVRRRR